MNPFNAITFAALCGPLAQPAAMAQEFITQPAPVMSVPSRSTPSIEDFARGLEKGKEVVSKVTISADDYYLTLIELPADDARSFLSENGTDTIEACELFLRAFEEEVKKTIAQNLPDFVSTELKGYWRHVAKARSAVTRLNTYSKSLFKEPVTFRGEANLNELAELASYTTMQLKNLSLH